MHHCLIVHNSAMNIAQKSSISNLFQKISNDKLVILIDHALLSLESAQNKLLQTSLREIELKGMKGVLRKAGTAAFHPCDETSLSSSFDLAFSYVLDTPPLDGLTAKGELGYKFNFADPSYLTSFPPEDDAQAYAVVHLCHWRVGGGRVMLNDLVDIDLQTSDALREKLGPLLHGEGIELFPFKKDAWLARSKHFKNLPSASLNKVMNDDVLPWLIGVSKKDTANSHPSLEPGIHILRRLQSEVQMFLYDQTDQVSTQNKVNSIWFSDTGVAPASWDSLERVSASENHEHELFKTTDAQILCLHELTKPMRHHDFNAWLEGLNHIDELIFKPLLQHPHLQIVLCGQNGFKTWSVQNKSWFQQSLNTIKNQLRGVPSTMELLS